MLTKVLVLPIIPLLFAYLELGGNWFGFRLIQGGPTLWSVSGTIVFSVLYSLVAAFVALKFDISLALLMVAYGFGFSIVSIFLILDWGKVPTFSLGLLKEFPALYLIAGIALVGFLLTSWVILRAH